MAGQMMFDRNLRLLNLCLSFEFFKNNQPFVEAIV